MSDALLFDTETNDRDNAEIIEACTVEVFFGNPTTTGEVRLQRFQPSRPITLGALSTHHIDDSMLVGCDPSSTYELPPCLFVVAHNPDFDCTAAGAMENGPRRIDTCALARECWPNLDCYSQAALIYHLDRQNARDRLKGAHGAAADVLLCKTILDAEIAHLGVASWEELWDRSEEARIPKVMGFGKHKGVAIGDLDAGYVRWLLNVTDPPIDPYLRKALTGDTKQRALFCPR